MIAAMFSVDQVGGIGTNGTLPCSHHPEDMKWFRDLTLNNIVVMGRKTWDDPKMPKPLPDRINYVVSNRSLGMVKASVLSGNWTAQIQELQRIHPSKNIYIIGGADLLLQSRSIIDFAYITHRKGNFRCETRLDLYDYSIGLRAISSRPSSDCMLNFTVYKNINSKVPLHEGLY